MNSFNEKVITLLSTQHPNAGCELVFNSPYELLVATILSAQCTDERVNKVTKVLFKEFNTPEKIVNLGEEGLKKYIFSCGFYNNKAKNIISMSKDLIEKYNGIVPDDFDKLNNLAGVGRKTASVVLCVAFNKPAMPVDTHVFRVSKRIGLSTGDNVEKVENDLKNEFPPSMWNKVHHTLIFHGRYICESRKPKCKDCSINSICKKRI